MNKKPEKCENCKKAYKHLKKYKGRCKEWLGKYLCGCCFRKTPRNPYFLQVKDRPFSKITKFTLSQAEKRLIYDKQVRMGYSSAEAWHKVNKVCFQMRMAKMRKAKAFKKHQMEKRTETSKSDTFKESFTTLK